MLRFDNDTEALTLVVLVATEVADDSVVSPHERHASKSVGQSRTRCAGLIRSFSRPLSRGAEHLLSLWEYGTRSGIEIISGVASSARAVASAGIRDVTFHDMRHAFAAA